MGLLGKGKRDTNTKGEISEAAIITRFLQLGYIVLTPYGGNQRYDLVIEDADGNFWRIQCKSAWIDGLTRMVRYSSLIRPTTTSQEKTGSCGTTEGNASTLPCIVLNLIRSTWFQLMKLAPQGHISG